MVVLVHSEWFYGSLWGLIVIMRSGIKMLWLVVHHPIPMSRKSINLKFVPFSQEDTPWLAPDLDRTVLQSLGVQVRVPKNVLILNTVCTT